MPTIEADKKDFYKMIGKEVKKEELEKLLNYAKIELDGEDNEKFIFDSKDANRPDLWSLEGIVRQIKGKTGEKGLPKYNVKKSKAKIIVDKSVKEIRPYIVGAVIKGIKINENVLKQIIQLQEKVAMTYGRKRREAAIGVYDYDKIKFPLKYTTKPKNFEFIPLGYKVKMSLAEILETHEKGKEYRFLLEEALKKNKLPIVIDSKGEVASMPPIINSKYSGQIEEKTKNLFIEVTGYNLEKIKTALNVMVCALADRGGQIESVEVEGQDYPDLEAKKIRVKKEEVEKVLGEQLNEEKYKRLLEEARLEEKDGFVYYPAYRDDVLHPIDIIEDVIISYGYNEIEPLKVKIGTIGKENEEHEETENIAELCVGAGLVEVLNFTLTDKESQEIFEKELVEIANPVSLNYAVFRANIFPQLIKYLGKNKDKRMPQKIFEIGRCLKVNEEKENGVDDYLRVSIAVLDKKLDYNYLKSLLDTIIDRIDMSYKGERDEKFFNQGIVFDNGLGKGYCGILKEEIAEKIGYKEKIGIIEFTFKKMF